MMDFIYELYKSDNFVMILSIVLVVLVLLFVLVFIFGKKDQKLEETKRLQKLEMDTFKKEKENDDVKLEVPVSESVLPVAPVEVRTEPTPIEEEKPISNEDANMVVFEPEEKPSIIPLEDEVENKIPVMPKPLFSDNVKIAGKTGSVIKEDGTHEVSFCGYFKVNNVVYTCLVIISNPKNGYPSGGVMAGNVVKEIIETLFSK